MKQNKISDAINFIDDDLIQRAEAVRGRNKVKKSVLLKWGAIAACFCLMAVKITHTLTLNNTGKPVLEWSNGFQAADYFAYSENTNNMDLSKSIADREITYAAERYFSDDRARMEANEIIPSMPDYPLYDCSARYNEDGSILNVTFSWQRQGDAYSDLCITAGYQEVKFVQDCISIELDEHGNIVPPSVTVTERDGIQIVAQGSAKQSKTLTFQNDTAWYQIAGSWNDGYEAVVNLLDWVWTHPIDFESFPMDKGIEITYSTLEKYPDAFQSYIPDFDTLGYVRGENYLALKDGEPYGFEGHYYAGVDEALVKDGSYLDKDGWTEIHWCITKEPDYYDLQESFGDLSELTEQRIIDTLSRESHISFMADDCFITVYAKEADELWKVIKSLIP